MWVPCAVCLDEPVMVVFWEFQDFQLLAMAPFILQVLFGPGIAFVGAALAGLFTYLLKRGKPSGALLHLLHSLELFPGRWGKLPGVLSPHPQCSGAW